MKTRILYFLIFLCITTTNAQLDNLGNKPRTFYPQVFFDKGAAEKAIEKGNSSIRGVAYAMDEVTGQTYYAIQGLVFLVPYTDYFDEWFNLVKKYRNYGIYTIYMQPGVFETRLQTYTDDTGNFVFNNIKPGKYYLQCAIKYETSRLSREQVGSNGYGAPVTQYSNVSYNTEETAYKVVEIDADGKMINVKLKSRGPYLLDTESLGAKTSKIKCYLENNMKNGTCYEYNVNGTPKEIAEWSKNRYEGDYKGYADNGTLIHEGKFKNGYKIDEWKYYDSISTKLNLVENYKYNKDKSFLEGDVRFYYPNGNLTQVDKYIDGKLNGESIGYYENGKLKSKVQFKDGLLNGLAFYYNENGEKNEEVNYKNGQPIK